MLEYLPHIPDPIFRGCPLFIQKFSPFRQHIFTLASSMRIPCKRGLWHRCPANRRSPRKSHRRRWTDRRAWMEILSLGTVGTIKHGWCQTWLGNFVYSLYMEAWRECLRLLCNAAWILDYCHRQGMSHRVAFTTQEEVRKMLTRGTLEPFKHFY